MNRRACFLLLAGDTHDGQVLLFLFSSSLSLEAAGMKGEKRGSWESLKMRHSHRGLLYVGSYGFGRRGSWVLLEEGAGNGTCFRFSVLRVTSDTKPGWSNGTPFVCS